MIAPRNRKYPRSYNKTAGCTAQGVQPDNTQAAQLAKKEERSIVLSMGAAAGILAAAFLNGLILGCIMKRRVM
ncbi:hypothetical protein CDQ84_04490 [Clostridium thermosuccinogenes]|jgi:hypothetical protein|uniref:Uncharacterized protein n=1 Tax=Clostridium thermosuccinogenes TaxID=84032 RepID=A0A2K2FPI3_9CLOT|nr:hypothetical protein [Pseudoclostridium thermosuccinogenes]AUS96117.1 hypothetical protein CDO33_06500 [Pseudoclostridium thermosuccinogenes]PNT98698.1 hypothetical protein CDQ85_04445 [Pseudoclostridium thermosuccinogenes]PNU00697.1 hypothetical protein CDQ84_04490 [Pseudoclostridium thermosuccinogenes]